MIIVDTNDYVVGEGVKIEVVDAQGETGLVKVTVHEDGPNNFYYIGNDDRDDYLIYNVSTPDPNKKWQYIDGYFIEVEVDNSDMIF